MVGNQHGNSLTWSIHITLRCLDPVRVDKGIYGPGQTLDLAGGFSRFTSLHPLSFIFRPKFS